MDTALYTDRVTPQPSFSPSGNAAEALIAMLRKNGQDAEWHAAVDAALEAAYVANNKEALAQVVHVMITGLDAEGRFDDALAMVEHSTAWMARHAEARALIQSVMAGVLLARGRVEAARGAIAAAGEDEPRLTSAFARAVFLSTRAVVDLVSLAPGAAGRAEESLSRPELQDDQRQALFVMSWLIPYLVADGRRRAVEPWLRSLRFLARAENHRWRAADALSFEYALRVALRCDRDVQPPAEAGIAINPTAEMRCVLAGLRASVVRREWAGVAEPLARLAELDAALRGSPFGSLANYAADVEAHRHGETTMPVVFPRESHLGNLPTILAGAEAVAHGGTHADAIRALQVLSALPRGVETSLEWPVARARIEGLLALRVTRETEARRQLYHAVTWARESGYDVERDLAAFQLGELYANGTLVVSEQLQREQRRDAGQLLLDAGIDAGPHALPVARALSRGNDTPHGRLAPREVEVLRLLADGCTYADAAVALDVKHSTVQTLAHRSYQKLGVNGRMAAINVARELGIL